MVIAFLSQRESLQKLPFVMSQSSEMLGCQWFGIKDIKIVVSRIREIVKEVWGTSIIISSSFYFFNKTDFEQYILNKVDETHEYNLYSKLNVSNSSCFN